LKKLINDYPNGMPNSRNLSSLKEDYYNKILSKELTIEELSKYKVEILKLQKLIRNEQEEIKNLSKTLDTRYTSPYSFASIAKGQLQQLENEISSIENEIVNKKIEFVDILMQTKIFV
jgi:hypothetical protein